jgi:hypothetical protein
MKTKITNCLILILCLCSMFTKGNNSAKISSQTNYIPETYTSLATTPAGAVELTNGVYQSLMLKQPCSFRVFSPVDPKWPVYNPKDDMASDGMRLVVYVLNLNGVPRPSAASDREIIEGLIKDGFLVVTVDFAGGQFINHLEMQKDINSLFCVFGGFWHTQQSWYLQNRKTLLGYPGPNVGMSYTQFNYSNGSVNMTIPVNRAGISVIPSGYTVKAHQVIRNIKLNASDSSRLGVSNLDQFLDIVYPKPSIKTDRVPLLLENTSNGNGLSAITANSIVMYSWLFNGYALASSNFISYASYFTNISALRYLDTEKDQFSLSGRVGVAGVSKSALRAYSESDFKPQKCDVDTLSYGKASNHVDVCMPVVGDFNDAWKKLDFNSPALVLCWNQLNDLTYNGDLHRSIYNAYQQAGIGEKCLFLTSPLAGHEYDVYQLNEIMAYFDKYCKINDSSSWSGNISTAYAGGDGTQVLPYLIHSGEDLAYLAQQANLAKSNTLGKYFKINADIDLRYKKFVPIGSLAQPFAGCLDGDNHKIDGLYIFESVNENQGLFGCIQGVSTSVPAVVKNLTLSSGYVSATRSVGAFVGRASYVKLLNCKNRVSVTGNISYVGGIVGLLGGVCIIDSCSNSGRVYADYSGSLVGGIFGNSYVSSTATDYSFVRYCNNTAQISAVSYVGGLGGTNAGNLTIKECYNTGNVTISGTGAGGIVGYGYGLLNILNCYNTGVIKQTANYTTGTIYAGGILGFPGANVASKYFKTITNCYNIGAVITYNSTGVKEAIAGSLSGGSLAGGSGTVANSYYLDTLSVTNLNGGVSLSSLAMQAPSFVSLLNNGQSPAVWALGNSSNGGYPVLARFSTPTLLSANVNCFNAATPVTLFSDKCGIVVDVLDNAGSTVSVYTFTGALIFQQLSSAARINIPVNKGVYSVRVSSPKQLFTGKVIVH